MPGALALYRRGMIAMAPAVVLSSAVSVLGNWPWTLEPIAEWVMLTTPVDLAQRLLLDLGPLARPLALLGAFALSLALGGVGGLIAGPPASGKDHTLRLLGTGLYLVLILGLAFPAPVPWPALVLAAIYLGLLALPRAGAPARSEVVSRRAVLTDSARIVGAAAALLALLLVQPWYRAAAFVRRGGRLFAFRPPAPRQGGFAIGGLAPEVTPLAQFYIMSKNLVDPDLAASAWRLRIDGMVAHPRRLSLDEVLALPARSQYVTQECVSNPVGGPLISCALFTGVSLRKLLDLAAPSPGAATVVMRATDGQADSIPLTLARHPDVMLAYAMDGTYLEPAHGYPARILVPGSYGFKSIKWVERIELVSGAYAGPWQERGWTAGALVHTTARIDVARPVPGGILVAGVAFAGTRGIRAVQVRANGGRWHQATLHTPPLSPLTWVQWRCLLPIRGRVSLEARAIDGTGAVQEERAGDIYPAGATGYHRVTVEV